MEAYIPVFAALLAATLIQCVIMVFMFDKMITNTLSYNGKMRFTPKMYKPNMDGEWKWVPYDNKKNSVVHNPSTGGKPNFKDEQTCLRFCEELERTGGLV